MKKNIFNKHTIICTVLAVADLVFLYALNAYCLHITEGTYNAIEVLFM